MVIPELPAAITETLGKLPADAAKAAAAAAGLISSTVSISLLGPEPVTGPL
jgi:hypothetical protein